MTAASRAQASALLRITDHLGQRYLRELVIPAAQIHQCEMAVMADNFACVAPTASLI